MNKRKKVLKAVQKMDRDDFEGLCLRVLEDLGFEISNLKSISGDILVEGTIHRKGEMKNFVIKITRSNENISSAVEDLKKLLSPATEGLLITTDKIANDSILDERVEIVGGGKLYQLLEKFDLLSEVEELGKKEEGFKSEKKSDFIQKGNNYLANGDYETAQRFYDKAIESGDNKALAFFKKGELFLGRGKYDKAIKELKNALEIYPNSVEIWALLGDVYDENNKKEKAVKAYNKAIELNENNLDVLKKKGRVLYEMKRYDEAILCFEDILDLESNSKEVWNNKALCHMRNGEYEESLESINNALSIDQKFEEALLNKALIFENMGEMDKALEVSKELVESLPDKSEYHYVRGAYLAELERYEDALIHMNRAVELDPENEQAQMMVSALERKIRG
ncbi:MAG: tetratricopeptide repeat protein [Candidatus Thermoplasmatota archaeon]|nr:tetratricopeptide repeat protein [Candidatus Thermoplasmatota archaeon]